MENYNTKSTREKRVLNVPNGLHRMCMESHMLGMLIICRPFPNSYNVQISIPRGAVITGNPSVLLSAYIQHMVYIGVLDTLFSL